MKEKVIKIRVFREELPRLKVILYVGFMKDIPEVPHRTNAIFQ